MTEGQYFRHIIYHAEPEQHDYSSTQAGGGKRWRPSRNHVTHGNALLQQFAQVWDAGDSNNDAVVVPAPNGRYLVFNLAEGCEDVVHSLDPANRRTRLCNVQQASSETIETSSGSQALVFIPDNEQQVFTQKLSQYRDEVTQKNVPRNNELVASIDSIQAAELQSFWTDDMNCFPGEERVWCEFWLDVSEKNDAETCRSFWELCRELQLEYKPETLSFPDICVVSAFCNADDLQHITQQMSSINEIRLLKSVNAFFTNIPVREQADWVDNLRNRMSVADDAVVVIGLLDTGVDFQHPLLQQFISEANCDAIRPEWHKNDVDGHGTAMAGLVAFGTSLGQVLQDFSHPIYQHRLVSTKLLQVRDSGHPKELWGDLTKQAISRLEIWTEGKSPIVCMAITAPAGGRPGRPTSWSSAIDQAVYGEGVNAKLMFVSAGNTQPDALLPYPERQRLNPIQDPAQAWNAITVGAFTELTQITTPGLEDREIVAQAGQLSPWSTTSNTWQKEWPLKPEIVMEGGNAYKENETRVDTDSNLELLTTGKSSFGQPLFTTANATSAATALAVNLAARIQAEYPDYWPETIRALIIHSAEWTPAMKTQFLPPTPRKTDYEALLRIVGYGVPDFGRAIRCAGNSLTIVAQKTLQPFVHDNDYRTKDMHIYDFPWPQEQLLDLGSQKVTLRVTLSYFIEPGPGEKSYQERYRYASHALNFEINAASENKTAFSQRINQRMRSEAVAYHTTGESAADRWLLGATIRKHSGSIHSDIWIGTAAELATSRYLAVYPAIGWWRERHRLKKVNSLARYSLVVSLSTDAEVDLYTPVSNALQVNIPVAVPV